MRKRQVVIALLVACILYPCSLVSPPPVVDASAPAGCNWSWDRIKTPNHPGSGFARRIAVRNAQDVWVGGSNIWHWNGSDWKVGLEFGDNRFQDIAVVGTKRVYVLAQGIKFWNGKKWKTLPLPRRMVPSSFAVVSSKDIWVATPSDNATVILHWDGLRWHRIGDPLAGPIVDISVVNSNDVWAAGGTNVFRWDGSQWNLRHSESSTDILRVKVVNAHDVWAVGSKIYFDWHANPILPFALHWDGTTWSSFTDDTFEAIEAFSSVVVSSPDNVWLVSKSFLWHWDGKALTHAEAGPPSDSGSESWDLASDGTNGLWQVGNFRGDNAWAQHGDGTRWENFNLIEPVQVVQTPFFAAVAPTKGEIWTVGEYGNSFSMVAHREGQKWSFADLAHKNGWLAALSAVSANDIWAVGPSGVTEGAPLLFHYDGKEWNLATAPPLRTVALNAVAARASDDVWAVGSVAAGSWKTLILHWDGKSWSVSPTPDFGSKQEVLLGVVALSPDDAWAVGNRLDGDQEYAIILHWNGTAWTQVSHPLADVPSDLASVRGHAANDLWAVGSGPNRDQHGLIEHWDGRDWQAMPNSLGPESLRDSAPLNPKSLWAIGGDFVAHWNGKRWRKFWSLDGAQLSQIISVSPHELWAVGATKDYYSLIVRGVCK